MAVQRKTRKRRTYSPEQLRQFRDYQTEFIKYKYRTFSIRFSLASDAEILKEIDTHDSVVGYIRELVLADIAKENKKTNC